ncbi:hypothetical protein EON65_09745 [archaeon]|nr:MAG: hypothetical protein EON65_09745 [archaeon]
MLDSIDKTALCLSVLVAFFLHAIIAHFSSPKASQQVSSTAEELDGLFECSASPLLLPVQNKEIGQVHSGVLLRLNAVDLGDFPSYLVHEQAVTKEARDLL